VTTAGLVGDENEPTYRITSGSSLAMTRGPHTQQR
jgi:hypothetical protein